MDVVSIIVLILCVAFLWFVMIPMSEQSRIHYEKMQEIKKGTKPVAIYNDWVKQQLPDDIPDDIIKQCLQGEKYTCLDFIKGLTYYSDADPGRCPPHIAYQAKDEEDLKHYYFYHVTYSIAGQIELLNREQEEQNWRYVRVKALNNKWMYRENTNYKYNAIYDSRKYWMEYHLNLLKPVINNDKLKTTIKEYESSLNTWYKIPHWKFDEDKFEFIEISDSKENNGDGIEHPTEEEIIK